MPVTFDFTCDTCGSTFESRVPLGSTQAPCPDCAQSARKLFSPPKAFIIPGGFQLGRSFFAAPSFEAQEKVERTMAALAEKPQQESFKQYFERTKDRITREDIQKYAPRPISEAPRP